MSKMVVSMQVEQFPSRGDFAVAIPIDDHIVREVMQPLDIPNLDSPLAAVFCTDAATIRRVKARRNVTAKELSTLIADAIIRELEKNDTVMGYTRDEYERFHGAPG